MQSTLDIVWLKRDIRLMDHAPLATASSSDRPLLILYNYEPDQLSEHSVHGSHVCFVNEGLIDLDQKLSGFGVGVSGVFDTAVAASDGCSARYGCVSNDPTAFIKAGADADDADVSLPEEDTNDLYHFNVITVCHAGIVFTLNSILRQIHTGSVYVDIESSITHESMIGRKAEADNTYHKQHKLKECQHRVKVTGINRILTHEETGHLKSFARDKTVRKWCRHKNIPIQEYNQTGVTRCLSSRDDFTKHFQKFLQVPLWETPSMGQRRNMRSRLVKGLKLHNPCPHPLYPHKNQIPEIPLQHRKDRPQRQKGGETEGRSALASFLQYRGRHYSSGISSPNTSWTTGGRISPYITWGNLSTRYIIHMLKRRQEELRQRTKSKTLHPIDGPFLRSLQAFSSRMHWRSHFIQKLESEPGMEQKDLCSAYQHLRRQEGDWNEEYYIAWKTGCTGYPFVDACMRCLLQHGWLNFRMRAMLVSFATYNLWLDWRRIAPHLARVFLDYEPGIHYPQLQMQAGTTGINAMRVYNVTKQGKDQDPSGIFVKRYVPELRNVPIEFLHEPRLMTRAMQERCKVIVGSAEDREKESRLVNMFQKEASNTGRQERDEKNKKAYQYYPAPIVNEKDSARIAKDKVAQVRKLGSTKRAAEQVYIKHGSRSSRNGNMDGVKPKALHSKVKRVKLDASMERGQSKINDMFLRVSSTAGKDGNGTSTVANRKMDEGKSQGYRIDTNASNIIDGKQTIENNNNVFDLVCDEDRHENNNVAAVLEAAKPLFQGWNQEKSKPVHQQRSWNCSACTFRNEKPLALTCMICGTLRHKH